MRRTSLLMLVLGLALVFGALAPTTATACERTDQTLLGITPTANIAPAVSTALDQANQTAFNPANAANAIQPCAMANRPVAWRSTTNDAWIMTLKSVQPGLKATDSTTIALIPYRGMALAQNFPNPFNTFDPVVRTAANTFEATTTGKTSINTARFNAMPGLVVAKRILPLNTVKKLAATTNEAGRYLLRA